MDLPKRSVDINSPIPHGPFYSEVEYQVRANVGLFDVGCGLTVSPTGSLVVEPGQVGSVCLVNTGGGIIGGPITTSGTVSLANVGIPGSYSLANITVDQYGRVVSASDGPQASQTCFGAVRLASFFDIQVGTNNQFAITPAGLQSVKSSAINSSSTQLLATSAAVKCAYDTAVCAQSVVQNAFSNPGEILAGTGLNSFIALPPGNNGQVLRVCSSCSAGLFWDADATGSDIPCSIISAKGDLIVGTGSATFTALGAGTAGQFLTVNAACPSGLQWTSLSASSASPSVEGVVFGLTSSGNSNTALGFSSLLSNSSGAQNVSIGFNSLTASISGSCNVSVGYTAMACNLGGGDNVAVGYSAHRNATNASQNTAVGSFSLLNNSTNNNTAVGYFSLYGSTSGAFNTAVGSCSLRANAAGEGSVAIGYQAAQNTTVGFTTAVGCGALANNTTGARNTALGTGSQSQGSTGCENTSVGYNSQRTSGACFSTAVGSEALCTASGVCNTAVGWKAGCGLTSGSKNLFLGPLAGSGISTGSCNIVIGDVSGLTNVSCNIYLGVAGTGLRLRINESGAWSFGGGANFGTSGQVLQSNGTGATPSWVTVGSTGPATPTTQGIMFGRTGSLSGCEAVSLGFCALDNVILGSSQGNVAIGFCSSRAITSGDFNTSVGEKSLASNQLGCGNTAIGYCAATKSLTSNNTVVGATAMACSISGQDNTVVGSQASFVSTTASCVTAVGVGALFAMNGLYNTAIGHFAGGGLNGTMTGCGNTLLGAQSGGALNNGSNNVFIGWGSGSDDLCFIINQSNHIILGNTETTTIVANVGTITTSDVRLKKVHGDVPLALNFVESLNPIKYQLCNPETGKVCDDRYRYGFSAQEVIANEENPDHPIIGNNSNPDRYGLGSDQMIPVLVNAIKELSAEVKALKSQISGG